MENPLLNESNDIQLLNSITYALETNSVSVPLQCDIFMLCSSLLQFARSDELIITLIRCITAYIKKGAIFCQEMINKGLFRQLIQYLNPRENNPKISIEISTKTRQCFMTLFSFKQSIHILQSDIDFSFFTDNLYEFPSSFQKILIKYTKELSEFVINDKILRSLAKISQILTHHDIEIVKDVIQILNNSVQMGNLYKLKVIDPKMAKYISISLEVITDSQLILILLSVLFKLCQISYEYAKEIVFLPIDFGIIIHNIDPDPRPDVVHFILKIIRQIFSFSTLRKSYETSKFAFYVQPLLIQLIKQNLGDLNLEIECLLITLDVYFPLNDMNDILDAIFHFIISTENKNSLFESFYKKLIENKKIKEAMKQYKCVKSSKQTNICTITDFNSLINITNFHISNFELNESLQNSILALLRSTSSRKQIEETFSFDNFILIKESLIQIADIFQKMLIFNCSKPKFKSEESMSKELIPQSSQFSLYDQSGKVIHLRIPSSMCFSICEVFFNLMPANAVQGACYSSLPSDWPQRVKTLISTSELNGLIDLNSIELDPKTILFNHFLCFDSNAKLTSPKSFGYFNFYNFKCQGKLYSVFDNMAYSLVQLGTNQFELIPIQMSSKRPTKEDFNLNNEDVCLIDFDAFHKSFINAYPTINLQKKSFNYYHKIMLPTLETSLQILREINRLFPDLRNAFENEIFGWRLLDKLPFRNIFLPNLVTSTFIHFPFLFPLKLRHIFLKLTAMSFLQSYFTFLDEIFYRSIDQPLKKMDKITIYIQREQLFECGLKVFNLLSPGSIYFDVKFNGETGHGIGPTREFFRLFALEMQRNELDIWLSDFGQSENNSFVQRDEENGLFPSPTSVRRPDLFFTLGSLCAKAIEMEIVLPLRLSPAFVKLLRGAKLEVCEVSAKYSIALKNSEGLLGLPFTFPGRDDVELRDGGKDIMTDESNVDLYVDLLKRVLTLDVTSPNAHFESNTWKEANQFNRDETSSFITRYNFAPCAEMFKEGFGRVIPWSAMDMFTPDEFCEILHGEEDLSLPTLRQNVVVGAGYNERSPQILWLFEILSSELSSNEKKLFARFVTGGDTFGVFGLKKLLPRLTVSKSEKDESSLPSVSTCTNSLKLPEYSSKEVLKKKLLHAIHECNETFFLA